MDYGCSIYASATTTSLKMLDTVHHQGIRLCTGAFRTSPVPSLYVESGEPSLSYRRNKLSIQKYTKLMGMPFDGNAPVQDAVSSGSMDFYFDRNSRLHTTLGYRVRKLFTSMAMPFPCVMRSLSYDVCPYTLQLEPMCPSVSNVRKRDLQQSHFRQLFTEHRQTHQNSVEVYTDGSKSDDAVSLAAVLPGRTIPRKLPLAATIYTAELRAMLVAPGLKSLCSNSLRRERIVESSLASLRLCVYEPLPS